MDIPALPLLQYEKRSAKPRPEGYPHNPVTFGENIRKKRMDLGLLQDDVAISFGTSLDTVTNWENGYYEPQVKMLRRVQELIKFE